MQLKELKQLVEVLGHAVLIEEGGTGLVVLPLSEYLELIGHQLDEEVDGGVSLKSVDMPVNGIASKNEVRWREALSSAPTTEQDLSTIEKLNQDIAILKEEIKKRELEELGDGLTHESVD